MKTGNVPDDKGDGGRGGLRGPSQRLRGPSGQGVRAAVAVKDVVKCGLCAANYGIQRNDSVPSGTHRSTLTQD